MAPKRDKAEVVLAPINHPIGFAVLTYKLTVRYGGYVNQVVGYIGNNILTEKQRPNNPILAPIKRIVLSFSRFQVLVCYCHLFKSMCYKKLMIAETRFNKVFLKVKRQGKGLYMDVFRLKTHWRQVCKYPKSNGNGPSAPCPTPHSIKMFSILVQNLHIAMKIYIWITKWSLTIQIRTIPYYWKSSLQYLLCLVFSWQPSYIHNDQAVRKT